MFAIPPGLYQTLPGYPGIPPIIFVLVVPALNFINIVLVVLWMLQSRLGFKNTSTVDWLSTNIQFCGSFSTVV